MLISSVLSVFSQFYTFASLTNRFDLFYAFLFYSIKFSEAIDWNLNSKLIKSICLSILFRFTGGNRTVCLFFPAIYENSWRWLNLHTQRLLDIGQEKRKKNVSLILCSVLGTWYYVDWYWSWWNLSLGINFRTVIQSWSQWRKGIDILTFNERTFFILWVLSFPFWLVEQFVEGDRVVSSSHVIFFFIKKTFFPSSRFKFNAY